MRSFHALEELMTFDFREMRGLGSRATDDALLFFHQSFNRFFSQFEAIKPTVYELGIYLSFLQKLTEKINEAEETYHYNKYIRELGAEQAPLARQMASHARLDALTKIPSILQFWAAGAKFGDTVRYSKQHVVTVKNLNKWNQMLNTLEHSEPSEKKELKKL